MEHKDLIDRLRKMSADNKSARDCIDEAADLIEAQEREQGECSSCKHAATVTVGLCVRCIDEVTIYHNYSPMAE